MGEMRNAYKIVVGKLHGKRLLEGHRRRWENNTEMVDRYGLDASCSGRGPVVNSSEHSTKLSVSIKGVEFSDQLSDY
jgi:hypothetical protein